MLLFLFLSNGAQLVLADASQLWCAAVPFVEWVLLPTMLHVDVLELQWPQTNPLHICQTLAGGHGLHLLLPV